MNPHQGTAQWHAERAGKVTCSRLGAILGLDPYCTARKYWEELVGLREPFAGNVATAWGQEHEADARFDYECQTGELVELCGFIVHPDIPWFGGSPDGLVGDDTVLEIKAPYSQKIPLLVPPHYAAQVQGLLAVTGRKKCHLHYWTPSESFTHMLGFSDENWELSTLPKLIEFYNRVVNQEWPDVKQGNANRKRGSRARGEVPSVGRASV